MNININNLLIMADQIEEGVKKTYPEIVINIMRESAEEIERLESIINMKEKYIGGLHGQIKRLEDIKVD